MPSAYCWSCTSFAPERAFRVMITAEMREEGGRNSVEREVESARDVGRQRYGLTREYTVMATCAPYKDVSSTEERRRFTLRTFFSVMRTRSQADARHVLDAQLDDEVVAVALVRMLPHSTPFPNFA